jgi:hypothetical protein
LPAPVQVVNFRLLVQARELAAKQGPTLSARSLTRDESPPESHVALGPARHRSHPLSVFDVIEEYLCAIVYPSF